MEVKKEIIIRDKEIVKELNISFGTILKCQRYTNEEEKEIIPKGHQLGPYVVIGYENGNYICLYCSSTHPTNNKFYKKTMRINSSKYGDKLSKDTYVFLSRMEYMNTSQIIKVETKLSDSDRIRLLKYIALTSKEGIYQDNFININYYPLEEGDIIRNQGKKYIIISKTNDLCKCLEIINSNNYNSINIDGDYNEIDYTNLVTFDKSNKIKRIGALDNELYRDILTCYKNFVDYKINNFKLQRGNLIQNNNDYYFIYGEFSNCYMATKVYDYYINKFGSFLINGKKYYSNFKENITFPVSNHKFTVIDRANDKELVNFKMAKKNFNRKNPNNFTLKENYDRKPNILPGAIVNTIYVKSDKYIVVYRANNNIVVIKDEDYKKNKLKLQRLNVNEVDFDSIFNPLELKILLQKLKENGNVTKGYISKEKMKELVLRYNC